jgi:hypothetical protein
MTKLHESLSHIFHSPIELQGSIAASPEKDHAPKNHEEDIGKPSGEYWGKYPFAP